jgi:hypothetical protein
MLLIDQKKHLSLGNLCKHLYKENEMNVSSISALSFDAGILLFPRYSLLCFTYLSIRSDHVSNYVFHFSSGIEQKISSRASNRHVSTDKLHLFMRACIYIIEKITNSQVLDQSREKGNLISRPREAKK